MRHGGSGQGVWISRPPMDELGKLDGAAFDQRFLSLMIQHHQGVG